METSYTARKVQPKGKESFVIEFRHPVLLSSNGKRGRKIRKGLGTRDENDAQQLVNQMNELLSDKVFWNPSGRLLAINKYDIGIVNAFYEGVDNQLQDYEKMREGRIPLKTHADGYSRVLLLGATGAGKTTLLRQMMGTDPELERFPATSTAKTTVFDTEIILASGNYESIVTFYTESETRQMIKDSIQKAMVEFYTRNDDNHMLRVFLEDKDQRFRLSYVLGKVKEDKKNYDEDIFDDETELSINDSEITEEEQTSNETKIKNYIVRIKDITSKIIKRTDEVLNENLTDEDKKGSEEIILSELTDYDEDDLAVLVDEILDEIKLRFNQLRKDEIVCEKFGWPIYWYRETDNRADFLKSIRFFSSNSSSMFGKLLTPLVSGMRVQGPFQPKFLQNIPKLVIFDGEGLGHISSTTTSLPYKTIKKFDESDAIVLVDNAQNPMQASPYAVIKSTAINGHFQKLFICLTHFDAVKGDNLPNTPAKIEHVFGSVDNMLEKLKTELDYDINKFLASHLHKYSYYLANIAEDITKNSKNKFTVRELTRLINETESAFLKIKKSKVSLVYDISNLNFRIRKGTEEFIYNWHGYLYGNSRNPKEHYTRIKALSLKLGYTNETNYSYLDPVSQLSEELSKQISNFLSSPISWFPSNPADDEKLNSIENIKKEASKNIIAYSIKNIKIDRISAWLDAYSVYGKGSALERANRITSIFNSAAPIPKDELTVPTRQFLKDIMKIVTNAIKDNDGEVTSIFKD